MIGRLPPVHPFTTVRLDRASERRDDQDWIKAQREHPETRYVPLWRNRCLVQREDSRCLPLWLRHDQIHPLDDSPYPPTLLGCTDKRSYFGVSIGNADVPRITEAHGGEFADLRFVADSLSAFDAGLLAYAKAMHYWQHRHTFCGVCGSRNQLRSAGHRLRCTNTECGRDTFPRIDPAVIVLVTHNDACLLGHQPGWPERRYSTLAGFVEPGESLEEAVAREVYEESGVRVHTVQYRSSQPWPFPASAMAGFHAATDDPALRLNEELEDARWLTAAELRSAVLAGEIVLPTPFSIAFGLVAEWYLACTGEELSAISKGHSWRRDS
ncbi:MAG: NAD(+) diphosphatase [Wenzhouxiangellaceae bacterium]